jgi:hypothetical protein
MGKEKVAVKNVAEVKYVSIIEPKVDVKNVEVVEYVSMDD